MSRRSRYSRLNQTLNVWQSFTDVMSSAFMILSLFLFLALLKSGALSSTVSKTNTELQEVRIENEKLKDKVKEKDREIQDKSEKIQQQKDVLKNKEQELQQKEKTIIRKNQEISSLKSQPPIEIPEASNRKFPSGSAELSDGLINFIQNNLVKQIEDYAQGKEGYIVQVIGHTDGQRNNSFQVSNLDEQLEKVAIGNDNISNLTPSSNADLGLMRALAVVKELENNPRLKQLGLKFRAYSAAQLYLPSGEYATVERNPEQKRRRIEIRFISNPVASV
ncbi:MULTISPECIES: hypothetical protein [Okeania]|uniref:Flagellar motor protein n=1 Tax=Okeania hirsuta TaxID=1458930 RepID=A0A3N6PC89_9CYAN|nr:MULTISPECIES: hypothetical protein [Okeania]NES90166.1 hypothetical protein [Okeania sp. SIO2B9]RQH25832.1 hypothetical protein D4Z78_01795 [Okeania hirsuta]RQH27406.1 hypothetical protein D5R40_27975 [Okeania hirsuta]